MSKEGRNLTMRSPTKTPSSSSMNTRKLWDFTQQPDIILQVENQDIYAHKTVLCNASPVFRVMLESEHFVEKNMSKIILPFKRIADVQQLLNFIYPFGHQISGITYC